MKTFNYIFCFVFILFAALQYNDPDPYLWIPIYLYPAALCWLASRGRFNKTAYLAGLAVFTLYALYKVFDANGLIDWITKHNAENITETMHAEKPWVEETREFFGLAIVISVLLIDYFYLKKRAAKPISS